MDRLKIEEINRQTLERYDKRLAEAGPGAYALGWGSDHYQQQRFLDLLHALEPSDINGKMLLDVGCGLADLYPFLKKQGFSLKGYIGTDINPKLLRIAGERYPDCSFEQRDLLLNPYPEPVADTAVLLGIMNFRLENQEEYAREMLRRAFTAVRNTIVFNAISDVHNEDHPREDFIYYHKPHEWLAFAQTLTPYCSLIHDYKALPQNEFMLVLRKHAWRTDDRQQQAD